MSENGVKAKWTLPHPPRSWNRRWYRYLTLTAEQSSRVNLTDYEITHKASFLNWWDSMASSLRRWHLQAWFKRIDDGQCPQKLTSLHHLSFLSLSSSGFNEVLVTKYHSRAGVWVPAEQEERSSDSQTGDLRRWISMNLVRKIKESKVNAEIKNPNLVCRSRNSGKIEDKWDLSFLIVRKKKGSCGISSSHLHVESQQSALGAQSI